MKIILNFSFIFVFLVRKKLKKYYQTISIEPKYKNFYYKISFPLNTFFYSQFHTLPIREKFGKKLKFHPKNLTTFNTKIHSITFYTIS